MPTFAMTFTIDLDAPAYVNRHSLTIGGKNDSITTADLLRFARMNDIKDADSIIEDVTQAIARFPEYAKDCGVDGKWMDRILETITIIKN